MGKTSARGSEVPAVQLRAITRLPREHRDALIAYGARTTWPCNFAIYEAGTPADGVFVVLRGQIVLRNQVGAGRSFVPWVASSGETFGSEGLDPDSRYASHARAEEESETVHLTRARFSALLREQPSHALGLIRQMMAERTALLEKFTQHATLTVEQRLVAALLRLAQTNTPPTVDRAAAAATPTAVPRRLLGELVGATRESISLVLGRLTADGLIQRAGNGLVIRDPKRLAERLESSSRVHGGVEVYDDRGSHDVPSAIG